MIAVIGAGVAGIVFAAMANRLGLSVSVIEQGNSDLSSSCAWRAGGMLAPWCEAETAEPVITELGLRSIELWPGLTDNLDMCGTLVVAPMREKSSLQQFSRRTKGWQLIDQNEIRNIEPFISERFESGLLYSNEGHLPPRKTLTEIFQKLKEAGVEFSFGKNFESSKEKYDWIINCSGMGAKSQLPNLRGVKGEMMLIRALDIQLNRPIRLLHPRHPIYIVPRTDNTFMVGATTIESESESGVSVLSAGELLTQVYNLHPAFGEAEILEFNSGLRPAFPDNRPRITVRGNKLMINGLYRHGFLLAPALAELALNYISNRIAESEVFDVD